jgi:hypothetical protein
MHTRELVELAAIVSAHGPVLVRDTKRFSSTGIEQYWTASKCRLDRWNRSLKSFSEEGDDRRQRAARWPFVRGVIEEILTGEALTRVWTAVLCAHDQRNGTDDVEPIARSVYIGHMAARHRVLTLLVRGPGIRAEQAVKLNHLRRKTERWTDMLIGYLTTLGDVEQFAFEKQRALDFAEDLHYKSGLKGGRQAWPLLLASLHAAFQRGLCETSPNADMNGRIGESILSCFQPELFDSTGLFRSLWLSRLSSATRDVQGMIDELVGMDSATPSDRHISSLQRFSNGR